jgi:nucleoside phosphorylase
MLNKKENIIESCKSIIDFLVKENDPEVRKLKYQDFKYKFAPFEKPVNIVTETKVKYDVIIFTVVKNELNALDKLLSFKTIGKSPKVDLNGIKSWEIDIERENNFDNLNALIVFIGEAGDLECSIAAMRVFQKFDCDLALLCGIAAGLENEIKKYSVVISRGVVDYEPQRLEKDGKITYRPNNYDLDAKTIRDATYLETEDEKWREYYQETIEKFGGINRSELDISLINGAELKAGIIASGRKLFADEDTLPILREFLTFKKGIISAEMESAGFCLACREFTKRWLVIRGISDYGGEDKNDKFNKKYQPIAAMAAFTAMQFYLKYIYRRDDEPSGSLDDF